MADKRPKTLRGGASAKMYIGAPKSRIGLRYEVGRGGWGHLKMEGAPHEEAMMWACVWVGAS